ncbi:ankyrin repeat-containing domain protein [Xylariomycetidae sp. FL2044]|nr:ankyrin repeat-containing domain protein [Xylariomycetidae sp. FL2044]
MAAINYLKTIALSETSQARVRSDRATLSQSTANVLGYVVKHYLENPEDISSLMSTCIALTETFTDELLEAEILLEQSLEGIGEPVMMHARRGYHPTVYDNTTSESGLPAEDMHGHPEDNWRWPMVYQNNHTDDNYEPVGWSYGFENMTRDNSAEFWNRWATARCFRGPSSTIDDARYGDEEPRVEVGPNVIYYWMLPPRPARPIRQNSLHVHVRRLERYGFESTFNRLRRTIEAAKKIWPGYLDLPDDGGYAPIHLAATRGSTWATKLLLDAGCTAQQPLKDTCSAYAALRQTFDRIAPDVYYTVDEGFSLPCTNRYFNEKLPFAVDALGLAILHGREDQAAILLKHHVKSITLRNRTVPPLHLAALSGMPTILRALLSHGEDANSRCEHFHNCTPLHLAATNGRVMAECLSILSEHGADLRAEDDHGREPVVWAIEHGASKHVLWFLENKIRPLAEIQTSNGYSSTIFWECVESDMFLECTKYMDAIMMTGKPDFLLIQGITPAQNYACKDSEDMTYVYSNVYSKALKKAMGKPRGLGGRQVKPRLCDRKQTLKWLIMSIGNNARNHCAYGELGNIYTTTWPPPKDGQPDEYWDSDCLLQRAIRCDLEDDIFALMLSRAGSALCPINDKDKALKLARELNQTGKVKILLEHGASDPEPKRRSSNSEAETETARSISVPATEIESERRDSIGSDTF